MLRLTCQPRQNTLVVEGKGAGLLSDIKSEDSSANYILPPGH